MCDRGEQDMFQWIDIIYKKSNNEDLKLWECNNGRKLFKIEKVGGT